MKGRPRLILLHQSRRIAGKRLDKRLCFFFLSEKHIAHIGPDFFERPPSSFSGRQIGNEMLEVKECAGEASRQGCYYGGSFPVYGILLFS